MREQTEEKLARYLLKVVALDLDISGEAEELLGEMGVYRERQKQATFNKAANSGNLKDLKEARSYMD